MNDTKMENCNKSTAGDLLKHEWEEQEANPHAAAHFGTWLFKPFNFLTLYDNGLNNFTGISYRVEAHKQHEMNYSAVQDTDSQLRFGELSIALVFQLLVPLLIILLAHGAITRERAGNTLRILAVQGATPSVLIRGKIAGNYAIILMLLLPALLLLAAGAWILAEPALIKRSVLFCIAYLAWFLLISIFTVLSSAWSKSSTTSLISCLGIWVVLLHPVAQDGRQLGRPIGTPTLAPCFQPRCATGLQQRNQQRWHRTGKKKKIPGINSQAIQSRFPQPASRELRRFVYAIWRRLQLAGVRANCQYNG